MRISDWSSDVCSSDLPLNPNLKLKAIADERNWPVQRFASRGTPSWVDYTRTIYATGSLVGAFAAGLPIWADRKSVVSGKRVSVRVDLGGRRFIKKNTKNTNSIMSTISRKNSIP